MTSTRARISVPVPKQKAPAPQPKPKLAANRYCQTNEGEVINWFIAQLPEIPKTVVDIGGGDGTWLSNSKHLEEDFGWQRFIIDGNGGGNKKVIEKWVTRESISGIFTDHAIPKEPGLISLDLDGNDWYIWEALLLSGVRPWLICTELNPRFKPNEAYAISYDPQHHWANDNYYGASWKAFDDLFRKYGYTYVHVTPSPEMPLNGFWAKTAIKKHNGIPQHAHAHPDPPKNKPPRWVQIKL